MSRAQQIWGLTGGVVNLSIACVFWVGLGTWGLGLLFYGAVGISVAAALLLVVRGVRLRRRYPGFGMSDVRAAPSGSPTHRMAVGFRVTTGAQTISIILIIGLCSWSRRTDLIWPLIGLVVSLHLAPLGFVFHVPAYYVVAAVGTAVCLASLFAFTGSASAAVLGLGLGVALWGCAAYLLVRAEAIGRRVALAGP